MQSYINAILKGSIAMMLFFVSCLPVVAQAAWVADSLYSEATGDVRNVRYIVSRHAETGKLPVLFLFHGLTGDHTNWTERTKVVHYLDSLKLDLIVVMPDADDSWYQNMAAGGGYYDFVADELPAWAAEKLGADTARQSVAGLSMGGYGALFLGATRPESYHYVGSFSGAFIYPEMMRETLDADAPLIHKTLFEAFGESDHPNRTSGDLYAALMRAPETPRPYIFVRHGIQDSAAFLEGHRKLIHLLADLKWPYEYHEVPGVHNWPFWDESIRQFFVHISKNPF